MGIVIRAQEGICCCKIKMLTCKLGHNATQGAAHGNSLY